MPVRIFPSSNGSFTALIDESEISYYQYGNNNAKLNLYMISVNIPAIIIDNETEEQLTIIERLIAYKEMQIKNLDLRMCNFFDENWKLKMEYADCDKLIDYQQYESGIFYESIIISRYDEYKYLYFNIFGYADENCKYKFDIGSSYFYDTPNSGEKTRVTSSYILAVRKLITNTLADTHIVQTKGAHKKLLHNSDNFKSNIDHHIENLSKMISS